MIDGFDPETLLAIAVSVKVWLTGWDGAARTRRRRWRRPSRMEVMGLVIIFFSFLFFLLFFFFFPGGSCRVCSCCRLGVFTVYYISPAARRFPAGALFSLKFNELGRALHLPHSRRIIQSPIPPLQSPVSDALPAVGISDVWSHIPSTTGCHMCLQLANFSLRYEQPNSWIRCIIYFYYYTSLFLCF